MKQHSRDKNGRAHAIGLHAETTFESTMKEKGWEVIEATKQENCNQHWDFRIIKGEQNLKVEVKAEKRINRSDNETQSDLVWIEFLGGNGQDGWLYGSADYVAFGRNSKFYMINREDLVSVVDSVVTSQVAYKASDALYKLYTRFRRKDLLTLIKFSDIESHCIEV